MPVSKDDVCAMLSRRHPRREEVVRLVSPETITEISDITIEEVIRFLDANDRVGADAVLRRAVHAGISALDLYESAVKYATEV